MATNSVGANPNPSIAHSVKAAAIGGGAVFALKAVPNVGLGLAVGLPGSALTANTIKAGMQALPFAAAAAIIDYNTHDGSPSSWKTDAGIGALTGVAGAAFLGHSAFAPLGVPVSSRIISGAIVGAAFGATVHFFDKGSK